MSRPHPADVAQVAATVSIFAFVVIAALSFGCYDANSPHLPPCPEGGVGYTDPLGCFSQTFDGGRDAR